MYCNYPHVATYVVIRLLLFSGQSNKEEKRLASQKVLNYLPEHSSLNVWVGTAIENLPFSFILKYDLSQLWSVDAAIFK